MLTQRLEAWLGLARPDDPVAHMRPIGRSAVFSGTGIYIRPDAVLAGEVRHGVLALKRTEGAAQGYLGRGPRSLSMGTLLSTLLAVAVFFAALYFLAPNGSAS